MPDGPLGRRDAGRHRPHHSGGLGRGCRAAQGHRERGEEDPGGAGSRHRPAEVQDGPDPAGPDR